MYVVPQPWSADTFVSAAVSVVFPWSTCPIVPTFTWGFVRSNFALAIGLALYLVDDLFGLRLRNLIVVRELHRVDRAALAHRAQGRRIPEHLGERHRRRDDLRVGALRHAENLAAPARQVAHDVADVVGGRDDLDRHDRLEQDQLRLVRGLLEGHRAGDLERHFARVHVVVAAVGELDLHVHDRVAGEYAVLERLLDALLDRADVFPRDRAADDLVLEHEAAAGRARLEVDDDVAVLAAAAGLADELTLDVHDAAADRLAVGHLRPADGGVPRGP